MLEIEQREPSAKSEGREGAEETHTTFQAKVVVSAPSPPVMISTMVDE